MSADNADYGAPTDAEAFIEAFLIPAFNTAPLVVGCDYAPGSLGSVALALDVELEDGSSWKVTVSRRSGRLPDLPTCVVCGTPEGLHLSACPKRFPAISPTDGSGVP